MAPFLPPRSRPCPIRGSRIVRSAFPQSTRRSLVTRRPCSPVQVSSRRIGRCARSLCFSLSLLGSFVPGCLAGLCVVNTQSPRHGPFAHHSGGASAHAWCGGVRTLSYCSRPSALFPWGIAFPLVPAVYSLNTPLGCGEFPEHLLICDVPMPPCLCRESWWLLSIAPAEGPERARSRIFLVASCSACVNIAPAAAWVASLQIDVPVLRDTTPD